MEINGAPQSAESVLRLAEMLPRKAELLDAADTEEERGNYASAARLRERAQTLTTPTLCPKN